MRGAEHDHRHRRVAGFLFRDREPDRGVRIDQMPVSRKTVRMVAAVSSSSARPAEKCARIADSARGEIEKRRDCASDAISAAHLRGVAATGLEQQALEIRRHLDVHRRRRGRGDLAHLIGAGRERARQDVVDVGGDHQPIDRQAHALGDIAREDVAEIAGRHREGDLAMRRAERRRGGEIVDHLRDDARPVDRVDAGQPHPVAEGVMVEQAFHQRLAIVERALDRKRMDVGIRRGRHHRRCTSEMRPFGNSTNRSVRSRPRNASTAAPPVSPEVATTMVVRSPRAVSA